MAALSFAAVNVLGQSFEAIREITPAKGYSTLAAADSPKLRAMLEAAVAAVISGYPSGTFKDGEVSATLIDLNEMKRGSYRGEARIYPASVVKLFYLAALERQKEAGKITVTKELDRGERDMIVDSSNEATQYILDVLTDTSSGAELPAKEFDAWQNKRNRVNRFFASMGYTNINVNQKTFCEDAYGIEQQSRNYKGENRNMLTTDATARLLSEIVAGRVTGAAGTAKMLELLRRDPFAASKDDDDQAHGFTGRMLLDRKMSDARIWSKAGWTSKARHDAAYVETADGLKFVLVVFTENHANEKGFIPAIAGKVIDGLREMKK